MRSPEHDDLIQGEIDGVNSPAASARLAELLAASPDLEARFRSLRRAAETLDGAERLAPPPEFVDGVMRATRALPPGRRTRAGWREALRSLFAPAPLAACAFTLVLGVVLGGLLPPDSLLSHQEQAALSGTVLPHGRLGAPGIPGRQPIVREGLQGEAVTRIEPGHLVVELDLETTRPVDVSLELSGTGLTPRSFSVDGAPGGEVVMTGEAVRFTQPAGRRRYSLSFSTGEPAPRALRLRVGEGDGWDLVLGRAGPR